MFPFKVNEFEGEGYHDLFLFGPVDSDEDNLTGFAGGVDLKLYVRFSGYLSSQETLRSWHASKDWV